MSRKQSPTANPGSSSSRQRLYGVLAGLFFGLGLLKFGNPVVLDHLVTAPKDLTEFIYQPWPVAWGYLGALVIVLTGLSVARLRAGPNRLWILLPAGWWVWQVISASQSIEPELTRITLKHFTACVIMWYVGLFALSQLGDTLPFWFCILAAFLYVLWVGFTQHYGGLESTREYFYSRPDWQQFPPEYLKKLASNRIFSTLVYPNALAGVIIILLPPLLVVSWTSLHWLRFPSRAVLVGLLAYCSLACLVWSGSKSGWLILLAQALIVLLHLRIKPRIKLGVLGLVLFLGLAGFTFRYFGYFERGATSVVARKAYWTAAWRTFLDHPVLGTGPGTFSVNYRKIKPPEAEMTLLVHNDYLQQGCDGGFIGFLAYISLILGSIIILYRYSIGKKNSLLFAIWVGLFGWGLQGFSEFGLYIPALSWLGFLLFGFMWGHQPNPIDSEVHDA